MRNTRNLKRVVHPLTFIEKSSGVLVTDEAMTLTEPGNAAHSSSDNLAFLSTIETCPN